MGEWSRQKNQESVAKATIKKEIKIAELDETRDEIRDASLERLKARITERVEGSDRTDASVRAIVEGEVFTFVDAASDANRELAELDYALFSRKTELAMMEPVYAKAAATHTQAVASTEAVRGLDRRDDVPHQGRAPLWGSVAVLVVLETFFQRRPIELIVRDQWPEFSDTMVSWLSLAASALAVGLSTLGLYMAAKSWGEYTARSRRADDTSRDTTGMVVGEEVSPVAAIITTAVAAVAQVVLFMLRFQTGASDSSTKTNLIFISALVMFAGATVAMIEFRSALELETLRAPTTTNAEQVIREYMALHREVYGTIPRRAAQIEQQKLDAVLAFLRRVQRAGDGLGAGVRDAVQDLIQEYELKLAAVKTVEYQPPSLPTGVRSVSEPTP
jgi:hypothetical protein